MFFFSFINAGLCFSPPCTGFRMFSNYVTPKRKEAVDRAAAEWQKVGQKIRQAQQRALPGRRGKDSSGDPLALPAPSDLAPRSSPSNSPGTSQPGQAKTHLFSRSEEAELWAPKMRAPADGAVHICDLKRRGYQRRRRLLRPHPLGVQICPTLAASQVRAAAGKLLGQGGVLPGAQQPQEQQPAEELGILASTSISRPAYES